MRAEDDCNEGVLFEFWLWVPRDTASTRIRSMPVPARSTSPALASRSGYQRVAAHSSLPQHFSSPLVVYAFSNINIVQYRAASSVRHASDVVSQILGMACLNSNRSCSPSASSAAKRLLELLPCSRPDATPAIIAQSHPEALIAGMTKNSTERLDKLQRVC